MATTSPFGKITISQNDPSGQNVNETLGYTRLNLFNAESDDNVRRQGKILQTFVSGYSANLTKNVATNYVVSYEFDLATADFDDE